jgi:hypothetical protein
MRLTTTPNFPKEVDVKSQFCLAALCLSLAFGWDSKPPISVFYSPQSHGDPKPSNAVEAIVKAFDTRSLVALSENHWLQEEADFIALLIRHPEFSIKVNDLVVEFGNALYQDVIDRYVAGKEVAPAELRQVWRNTTQLLAWNPPIYERFFANVRALNQTLPASRRLRVLLGDPPIDWNRVQTREEIQSFGNQRDQHYAEVVEDEVLAKGRKALLIAGGSHFTRKGAIPMKNAGGLIEKGRPKSLFVIVPHTGFLEQNEMLAPRIESWPTPSLSLLKGTWLGALDASLAFLDIASPDGGKCLYNPNAGTSIEDMADAYLYLGPGDSLTRSLPPPDLYKDEAYVNELKRRHKLKGGDFDPAGSIAYIMDESSKKYVNRPPFKLQKKCP